MFWSLSLNQFTQWRGSHKWKPAKEANESVCSSIVLVNVNFEDKNCPFSLFPTKHLFQWINKVSSWKVSKWFFLLYEALCGMKLYVGALQAFSYKRLWRTLTLPVLIFFFLPNHSKCIILILQGTTCKGGSPVKSRNILKHFFLSNDEEKETWLLTV